MSSKLRLPLLYRTAIITVVKEIQEPKERSRPLAIMRGVIATARTPIITWLLIILLKFR
jgi:hypothetical protein